MKQRKSETTWGHRARRWRQLFTKTLKKIGFQDRRLRNIPVSGLTLPEGSRACSIFQTKCLSIYYRRLTRVCDRYSISAKVTWVEEVDVSRGKVKVLRWNQENPLVVQWWTFLMLMASFFQRFTRWLWEIFVVEKEIWAPLMVMCCINSIFWSQESRRTQNVLRRWSSSPATMMQTSSDNQAAFSEITAKTWNPNAERETNSPPDCQLFYP